MSNFCNKCNSNQIVKAGFKILKDKKVQKFKCKKCSAIFTGKEKYLSLSNDKQLEILKFFKNNESISLNKIASIFGVKLFTVQYLINKVRKYNPENERKYQERMKNRVRSLQEIKRICNYYQNKKYGNKKILLHSTLPNIPSFLPKLNINLLTYPPINKSIYPTPPSLPLGHVPPPPPANPPINKSIYPTPPSLPLGHVSPPPPANSLIRKN
jgi:transposase-like protein